jgi:hypothetical protein
MFIPFDSLPDHARIWIYQSDRKFNSTEADIISQTLSSFTQQWEVHGQPMKASFKLYYDQFIILAADEGYNEASGCSIDGSVRLLKQLGTRLSLDFFDRNGIAFKNADQIFLIPMPELKTQHVAGKWRKDTLVFNNLVATKADLERHWVIEAGQTWLKRYLSDALVNRN